MFILLLRCRLICTIRNPTTLGTKCWGLLPAQLGLYTNAAMGITINFVSVLLPITYISEMKLTLGWRIVIGVLACLGYFTSGDALLKCF